MSAPINKALLGLTLIAIVLSVAALAYTLWVANQVLPTIAGMKTFMAEYEKKLKLTEPITFGSWTGPEGTDIYIIANDLVPRYMAETGAKVHHEIVSRDIFREKLAGSLIAKSGEYDVIWVPTEWLPELADYIEPLDDFMAKHSDIVSPGFEEWLNDCPALKYSYVGGKLLFFPVSGYDTVLLFYRTDLFKKYGIVDEAGNPKPPQTWEEYLDVAKKLTVDEDGDGKIDIYGTALFGKTPESIAWDYIYYLWSFGGEIFDPETYKVTINSPEGIEALAYFSDLLQKHHVVPEGVLTYEFPEVYAAFQTGKIAMCIQWQAAYPGWSDPETSPLIYDKFSYTLCPGKRLPDGTIRRVTIGHQWGVILNKYSVHKLAAYKFMEWLMLKENQKRLALGYGVCGSYSAMIDPEVVAKYGHFQEVLAEQYKYTRLWPLTTVTHKIIISIATHSQEALAATLTPKEALDLCADEIETYLKEAGYLS